MEPALARPRDEAVDHDDLLVHEWRVTRRTRLGIPWSLAQAAADHVDWHRVAEAGAPRLPTAACAPEGPVRQSPMAGSLRVQRLTGDAWWAHRERRIPGHRPHGSCRLLAPHRVFWP